MCHTSNVLLHNSVGVSYQPNAPLVPNQMRVLSSGLGPQATGLLLGGTPYCSLWHRDSSGLCGQHQISGSAVGAGSSMCTACACCVWLPGNTHKGMQLICTPLVPSSPSLPPQISPWTLPPPLPPFSCSSLPQSLPRPSLLLSLSFLLYMYLPPPFSPLIDPPSSSPSFLLFFPPPVSPSTLPPFFPLLSPLL